MIFTREITPASMRRGIWVESRSTPSTRKRTRMSRPSGSKWMSEAPSSTAPAISELTSLMTGAFSADSRISATSARSSSPSETASATASSSLFMRPIRPWMSSAEATTGRTSWPVISFRSSSASTFDGSAIATISAPSSPIPIGTAVKRRAACTLIRLSAEMSALKMPRSTWCSPKRCATARAYWSRADGAGLDQQLLGRAPGVLALLDGRVDALARDEAELDDDVGDEARAAALRCGGVMPLGGRLGLAPALLARSPAERAARPHPAARSSRVRKLLDQRLAVDEALDQVRLAVAVDDHDRRRLADAQLLDSLP